MKHLLPEMGAGRALHLAPPRRMALRNGGVSHPPVKTPVLFTKEDRRQVYSYDAKMCGWDAAKKVLQSIELLDGESIDISAGGQFPWWLWLANDGNIQSVIGEGVLSFHIVQVEGFKCFKVRTGLAWPAFFVLPSSKQEKMLILEEDALQQHIRTRKRDGHMRHTSVGNVGGLLS